MGRTSWIICGAILAVAVLGAAAQESGNARKGTSNAGVAQDVQIARDLDRIAGAHETQRTSADQNREQRDLDAQEGMAYWARAMFWATIAAVALSGLSVILIFVTFRESKRAADAADKMAEEAVNATKAAQHSAVVALQISHAQLRPWLKLEVENSTCRWMIGESGVSAHVAIKITNTGVSPALQCGTSVEVSLLPLVGKLDDPICLPDELGMMAPIFTGDSVPYGCSFQRTHEQVEAVLRETRSNGGMPCFVFDFKVSYRTPFSDDIKESALRYLIMGAAGDQNWLAHRGQSDEDVVPRVALRVQSADVLT